MAETEGEVDPGVLSAVRYHSVGWSEWDDVGRMLYLADYLEPGRDFPIRERAELIERVPRDTDAVLCEVAQRRIETLRKAGLEPLAISVAFLESLQCGV
jgi:HD superfamily phosphohydrolase YqeK